MARPALSATRAIDILDLFAGEPGRIMTMSEIMRATDINVASCHAVLNALVERGYLERVGKAYCLGKALVAVGSAAAHTQPLVGRAEDAVDDLCERLRVAAQVSAIVGDEILALKSRPDPQGRHAGLRLGQRVPLVPPNGAHFMAWASPEEINAWIARSQGADEDQIAEWRHALEQTRARGYQVTLRTAQTGAFAELMRDMATGNRSAADDPAEHNRAADRGWRLLQPEKLLPEERYDIVLIAAPVFDSDGRAVLSMQLGGFAEPMTGGRIESLAKSLLEACLNVMRQDRDYQISAL